MKKIVKKSSSTSRTKTTTPVKKYAPGGSTKKTVVPECSKGYFWDGSKCVDSKTNRLPKTVWTDDLVNEVIPTYDKKTGKREYQYSEGIFDNSGRKRTVDYDEVKKQQKENKKTGGPVKKKKK
jgi:hypothetical protein